MAVAAVRSGAQPDKVKVRVVAPGLTVADAVRLATRVRPVP
jgi:hypothetical protein